MLLPPSAPSTDVTLVESTIEAARRRSILVLALTQLSVLVCVVLGFLILLALLGTDVLPPSVVVAIVIAACIAWALWIRQSIAPSEAIARVVDHKLSLHDTLSTAHFLINNPPQAESTWTFYPVHQAAVLARTIRPEQAFPFTRQRRWFVAGLLFLVAIASFATRYLVIQTLSLRPPLLTLALAPVAERIEQALGAKELKPPSAADSKREKASPTANASKDQHEEAQQLKSPPFPSADSPKQSSGEATGASKNQLATREVPDPKAKAEPGDQSSSDSSNSSSPGSNSSAPGNPNDASTKEPPASQQKPSDQAGAGKSSDSQNQSLMSRMKDALSSVMAKMNRQGEGQKSANSGDSSKQAGQQAQQGSKSGEQNSAQSGNSGQDKANSEQASGGQGEGQTAEKPGSSQGQSSSNSQQSGSDSQSGVGRQDGDKALRDAQQQQAMGKLAEILGKRSATLTGDMSVETPSGNQQLKTQYSNQQRTHSDRGGEINRNEVPPQYQQYVRDYMDQVHRQPAKTKK